MKKADPDSIGEAKAKAKAEEKARVSTLGEKGKEK
jgi:hypothetical protein